MTAPLVCARVPAELLVLVAAMVPAPGEPPGDWWQNTGWAGRLSSDPGSGAEHDQELTGARLDLGNGTEFG